MNYTANMPRQKSRALIISVFIHLLLILLLFLFKDTKPVQILFEVSFIPEKKAIPEKEKIEIKTALAKVRKSQKRTRQQNKESSSTNHKTNKTSRLTKEDQFLNNLEKTFFSKKASKYTVAKTANKNSKYKWNNNKSSTATNSKKKSGEKVKIPSGKTKSGKISWLAGRSRKLLFKPPIVYPLYYRKQSIQASVLLRIEVSPSGSVNFVSVLRSSGYAKLDILAKNGMRRARFSASGGNQVDRGDIEIRFTLK